MVAKEQWKKDIGILLLDYPGVLPPISNSLVECNFDIQKFYYTQDDNCAIDEFLSYKGHFHRRYDFAIVNPILDHFNFVRAIREYEALNMIGCPAVIIGLVPQTLPGNKDDIQRYSIEKCLEEGFTAVLKRKEDASIINNIGLHIRKYLNPLKNHKP